MSETRTLQNPNLRMHYSVDVLSRDPGRLLTFAFTIRWDHDLRAFLVQDSYGALLGVSPDRGAAMQCARREAALASQTGVRVIVLLQNAIGEFDHVATADPPAMQARSALIM